MVASYAAQFLRRTQMHLGLVGKPLRQEGAAELVVSRCLRMRITMPLEEPERRPECRYRPVDMAFVEIQHPDMDEIDA